MLHSLHYVKAVQNRIQPTSVAAPHIRCHSAVALVQEAESHQVEVAGLKDTIRKLESELEGLSNAYAMLEAHSRDLQAQLEPQRAAYEAGGSLDKLGTLADANWPPLWKCTCDFEDHISDMQTDTGDSSVGEPRCSTSVLSRRNKSPACKTYALRAMLVDALPSWHARRKAC